MTIKCRAGRSFNSIEGTRQLLFLLLLSITALAIADRAIADTGRAETNPVEFSIPAQTVPAALNEFARQARVQLFFITDGFENVPANAVFGTYSRQKALDLLLAGTGLRASLSSDSGIKVRPVGASANSLGLGSLGLGSQLFAAGAAASADTAAAPYADERDNAEARQTGQDSEWDDAEEASKVLEEIIVTGTHIRGVKAVGAASISFTREELDNSGYSTVEDFFQSLPQNLDEISGDGAFAVGTSRVSSANSQGASSISLRGLGPGSTLVLLNGKRRPGNINGRVFDVSAIPLSMVERVELVTGGRSAIYGSDAVAGVVNIVTRSELDGADTQVYYGESSAGGERFNFSQTFGREFERGGFILGYDYRKDEALDATDTGVLTPSPAGLTPILGLFNLRWPSEQHVGLLAGHFELSDKAELYADAQFSSDENEFGTVYDFRGFGDFANVSVTESDQYSANVGVRVDVGKDWQVDVSALYGIVDNSSTVARLFGAPGTITSFDIPLTREDFTDAELTSFSAIADGPIGTIGDSTISAAIGVDFRNESFERTQIALPAGTPGGLLNVDRDVWSIFGEVHLPLLNRSGQRLEVSLAGRYDDYSDFGDTFNPQLGVDWEPISGLTLRGSYSEAFRAPDLFTLHFGSQVVVRTLVDPADPSGLTTVTQFGELGGNPALQPEEAETYTVGIDWEPSDHTKLSLSYFNIEYLGRIDQPAASDALGLQDESFYPGLINRSPTVMQVDVILDRALDIFNLTGIPFDPATDDPVAIFSNIILFDNRRNNIAIEALDGLDFQASIELETGSGDWSFGLNGTYYLDFERNITATAPTIEQLNQPGKLVDLKVRGGIGWSRSAWSVIGYVNYVDSYDDTFAATPTEIDSWTTVDLTLRFDGSETTDSGVLNGVSATLGINNLFDEDPPVFLNNTFGLGYDAANSDPIGRFVSLRLAKRW